MPNITRHVNSTRAFDLEVEGRGTLQNKIYVGFVKEVDDLLQMGRLRVWIPELSGDPADSSGWFLVSYCSPFAGATSVYDNKNTNDLAGTQKSYGMWFVPPDINNEVVVAFINGDPGRGIWLGCLYQQFMNHMVPGLPGQDSNSTLPVAEYNKKTNHTDLNKPDRPNYTPLADALVKQGLDQDVYRGVSSSGARRSSPANSVYGILTPGGNQMVFDDNPGNSYIRFRTQQGAQLLINDTMGCIYLNSVDGNNWISMDANGRVDIYAKDDISIRSQGSVNIRGDLDVNIEAGRDVNIRARGKQLKPLTPNPTAEPPNVPPNLGNVVVVGDSIAMGVGQRIEGSITFANEGNTSTAIADNVQQNAEIKNATNAVISAGSNDVSEGQVDVATLTANLGKIRDALTAKKCIWLLPYNAAAKAAVLAFASSKSDETIDLSTYPTSDNFHPRDYALVANDVQAKCLSTPSAIGTTATGGIADAQLGSSSGQPGAGQYATPRAGAYSNLSDAQAAQQRYTSAADYARQNPNLYTPEEKATIFRMESNANAEVARLSSSGGGSTAGTSVAATQSTITQQSTTATTPTAATPAATDTTGTSTSTSTPTDWRPIAAAFIKKEEGGKSAHLKAYPDGTSGNFSIGWGHYMKNEVSKGQTWIDAGPEGKVQIVGPNGRDTVVTAAQADAIFEVDLDRIGAAAVKRGIKGAWDLIGPYQRAALVSYAYNVGNVGELCSKGLTDYINRKDIESGAKTIETSALTGKAGGKVVSLAARRKREADLYREKPELANSTAAPSTTTDGYPQGAGAVTATAQDSNYVAPADNTIEGGFVKISSFNSMHLLSEQYMFITSQLDMHRLAGKNIFDTALASMERVAGGHMHESVKSDYTVTSNAGMIFLAPRIDMNGPAPPPAVTAAGAIAAISTKQTDAVVNGYGNVTAILTDTILPHLPFHEPYDNHGGRNFETIRDATSVDTNTGLREGEIIANSDAPLDIQGTPRPDMPVGSYIGAGYNVSNQPLYRYSGNFGNVNLAQATTFNLSQAGEQFIKVRENGSYRPIIVGNPPKQEIGFGHSITPDEISSQRILINGQTVTLQNPLTQPQIDALFQQDIQKTQDWMKPEIKVPVSQTQYDMLCSLAFNIGENNFKNSAAIKALNEGYLQRVPNLWMQHVKNGGGQTLPGLQVRRRAEIVKFMTGPEADATNGGNQSNAAVNATEF